MRVDLSTGKITAEDTIEKYRDTIGGTGLGYQVLWEEVAPEVKAFDPENKIIFATGPLAGTSAPCSGRTAITMLWPVCWPKQLVGSGHMGGHFAAELKYAGFDAVIIEGRAHYPVWLAITDGKAEIRDARRLWGQGIRRTTHELSMELGPEAVVAAIGPAGENMVPMSVIINSVSHSAAGGAVMGSKNLKAIGVRGTGSIRIGGEQRGMGKNGQVSSVAHRRQQPKRGAQQPAALGRVLHPGIAMGCFERATGGSRYPACRYRHL